WHRPKPTITGHIFEIMLLVSRSDEHAGTWIFSAQSRIRRTFAIVPPSDERFDFLDLSVYQSIQLGDFDHPFALARFHLCAGIAVQDRRIAEPLFACSQVRAEQRLADVLITFENDHVVELAARLLGTSHHRTHELARDGPMQWRVVGAEVRGEQAVDTWSL